MRKLLKLKYLRVMSLLIALSMVLLPTPSHAAQPDDPDDISAHAVAVFQNIYETGDMLFVISCNIEYAVEPSGNASSNFIFSLYDSSNSTLVAPVRPASLRG